MKIKTWWLKTFSVKPQLPNNQCDQKTTSVTRQQPVWPDNNQCDQKTTSVTRQQPVWPDNQIVLTIYGYFQHWKFAQKHTNCTKVSWKLRPKPNKPSIYYQRFLNICQSGEISPNLVTLPTTKHKFPIKILTSGRWLSPELPLLVFTTYEGTNAAGEGVIIIVVLHTL